MYKIMLIISVIYISCIACGPADKEGVTAIHPMDRLPDNKAGEVVKKAIDQAGGWDTWEKKEKFQFYKNITQLDSSGTIKKTVRQYHQYDLEPGFSARMTWSDADGSYVIINNGERSVKYKNTKALTDDQSKNEAWNSSYGSHYVVTMPFKLTDPGVTLRYDGIDTTIVGRPVHAVNVQYAKDAGSTGGMHEWWYYFDQETYDLAANYLDYGEGQSVTTYKTFENVDGIRIHNKRYSYSSNKQKEKVLLRTIYENDDMRFNQNLPSDTFILP